MARRLFYDPVSPRMLSEEEISKLSPVEIQAACDQIDQNLVGVLQTIDENFSKAYQSLTANILPAVEQYGQHSKDIWDSVKFWKFFFEAAANTKLGEPSVAADESFRSADLNNTVVSFAQDGIPPSEGERTPKAANETSTDTDSPFQTLRKEIRALDGLPPSASSQGSTSVSIPHRLRLHELPPDSPDIPLPEFETLKIGMSPLPTGPSEGGSASSSSIASSKDATSSPRRPKAGADRVHPDLLQKVLRKQFAAEGTPKAARTKLQRPDDVPAEWDGIIKLSDTPLSAFMSPRPAPSASTSHRSAVASPLPKLGRTPKKEAANRMAQNVYNALDFDFDIDSPEPPSAVKNWHTRSYNLPPTSPLKLSLNGKHQRSPAVLGSATNAQHPNASHDLSTGHRDVLPGGAAADEGDESLELDLPPAQRGLQDFGGTTARIDDLLDQDNLARLVDDDEDRPVGDGNDFDDDELTGSNANTHTQSGDAIFPLHPPRSHSRSNGGGGAPRNLDGPEDTLFGMPAPNGKGGKSTGVRFTSMGHGDDDDDSAFSMRSGAGAAGKDGKFKVMGIREHDMETLHGGQLLESEPYVESPLLKRDNRY